jgi:hypothetical protein
MKENPPPGNHHAAGMEKAFHFSFPHDETFPIKQDCGLKKLDGFGGKGFLQPRRKSATPRDSIQKTLKPDPPSSGMFFEKGFCKPVHGGKQ